MSAHQESRLTRLLRLQERLAGEIESERAREHRLRSMTSVIPPLLADQPLRILAAAAAAHDTTPPVMLGTTRTSNVAQARAIAVWVARDAGLKVTQVAELMQCSHTRISAHVQRVNQNPVLLARARQIRDDLMGIRDEVAS